MANDKKYIQVLEAMQILGSDHVKGGVDGWCSLTNTEILKLVFNRLGVTESFISLTGDSAICEQAYSVILIGDLIEEFSMDDIMLILYYTFDIKKYKEVTSSWTEDAVQNVYGSLVEKLNLFIMKTVSKFTVDPSIASIVKKDCYITNEMQARILMYGKLTSMENICQYGNVYSEEFTDYIIDQILLHAIGIYDSNKRTDWLENIYTLLNSRIKMPFSEHFAKKNKEVIRQISKIHISRGYSFESMYKLDRVTKFERKEA